MNEQLNDLAQVIAVPISQTVAVDFDEYEEMLQTSKLLDSMDSEHRPDDSANMPSSVQGVFGKQQVANHKLTNPSPHSESPSTHTDTDTLSGVGSTQSSNSHVRHDSSKTPDERGKLSRTSSDEALFAGNKLRSIEVL